MDDTSMEFSVIFFSVGNKGQQHKHLIDSSLLVD